MAPTGHSSWIGSFLDKRPLTSLSAQLTTRRPQRDYKRPFCREQIKTYTSAPFYTMQSQNVTLPEIPELYDPNFLDILLPPSPLSPSVALEQDTTPKNPMIDALIATSERILTTNGAPAYNTTQSATLDAFSGILPNSYGKKNVRHLTNSWAEDPNLTLRIIWNIRSIHDGKSDKELFYRAFGWLYDNHPRTAIANLHLLVKPVCTRPGTDEHLPHGYWKDLLNILALAAVDELSGISEPATFLHNFVPPTSTSRSRVRSSGKKSEKKTPEERDARIAAALEATARSQAKAKEQRKLSMAKSHERIVEKLAQPKFRALYIAVVRLFGEQLKREVEILDKLDSLPAGEDRIPILKQLSLVGKWAPTPGKSHDRQTNITTAICQYLLRSQGLPTPLPAALSTLTTPQDMQLLRSFFQRWVLTPLRKALGLPERLMTANRWKEIRYNRVASVCMKNNAALFYKHDPEGFEKYITSVESGVKKISGAVLLPHDILETVLGDGDQTPKSKKAALKKVMAKMEARVAEAQWKTMISRLRESGTLENSLAICDVSGSMGEFSRRFSKDSPVQPVVPAVALSLVLAQLAKPPFHNGFITFSASPQFVRLDPTKTLAETAETMHGSDWGMNTNLRAVFIDLLLPLAVNNNLKPEDMIKRLFIFSDMHFDDSVSQHGTTRKSAKKWETTHDVIEKEYERHGYKVPQIVYWNLAAEDTEVANPVTAERNGVAMMNGFSPAMLKVFMGESEAESPAEAVGVEEDTSQMDADGWEDVDGATVKNDDSKVAEALDSWGDAAMAKADTWEDVGGSTVEGGGAKAEDSTFTPLSVMKSALSVKSFDELVVLD